MAAAAGCAVVAFLFLGFLFRVFYDRNPKDGPVRFILRMIFYVPTSSLYGVTACIGIVLCIRQALRPFFQDLDDLSRDKLVFEF